MESIKERVEIYLDQTGMTKEDIAGRLGISRQAFWAKLEGVYDFKLSEAEQLASIIGCTVDELRKQPKKPRD